MPEEVLVHERPLGLRDIQIGVPEVLSLVGQDLRSPEVQERAHQVAEYLAACSLDELFEKAEHVQQLYCKVTTNWGMRHDLEMPHVDLFADVLREALLTEGSQRANDKAAEVRRTASRVWQQRLGVWR